MTVVMGSDSLMKGGEENVDQHQRMRSMQPFLFQVFLYIEEGD